MSKVKKGRTALIVIDLQNFLLDEKAEALGISKYAKEIKLVQNTQKAIEKLRGAGIPIIYVQTILRPEILLGAGIWKMFKGMFEAVSIEELRWRAKIIKELAPHSGDYIIRKCNCMNAFYNTELDMILRGLKCDTLIFTGVATNFCVESSVRDACDRGYKVMVLSNCVAAMNEEAQKFALSVIFPMLGEVTTVEELGITS